jgi:hypothetical protein
MRICSLVGPCLLSRILKESSASCYLALVRRFLRPCVLSTSRVLHLVMSFSGTLLHTDPTSSPSLEKHVASAPLCSCSGAFAGHKKPDSPRGRSGPLQSLKPVHIWPCPDSSDLAPFPSLTTVAVVNTPLSQRNVHYRTPAPVAATSRRAGFRWVASLPAWAG